MDLHVDETGDPTSTSLRDVAECVIETGFDGPVTVGHCCSLAVQEEAEALATLDLVARADLHVVSLPMCNLYLQSRVARKTPRWRGITLVHEMKERGIGVSFASDNTRDPFYAYGDLDMLEVMRETTRIGHLDHSDSDWTHAFTTNPARAAGFALPSLDIGAPADLVICRARSWTELFARPQSDRLVLRAGRPIDRTLPDYAELDDLMNGRLTLRRVVSRISRRGRARGCGRRSRGRASGPRARLASGLERVGAARHPKRHPRVLLHEDEAHPVLAVDGEDRARDLLHEHRGEPERRLVEEEEPRAGHQRPPDGEHLLFAPAHGAGRLAPALAKPRKALEHPLDVRRDLPPPPPKERPHEEVVHDREVREDAPPLRHHGDPEGHDLVRPEPVDAPPVEDDLPRREPGEPGDGAQRRRLAGPVRPDEGHDVALVELDRHARDGPHLVVPHREVRGPEVAHDDPSVPARRSSASSLRSSLSCSLPPSPASQSTSSSSSGRPR